MKTINLFFVSSSFVESKYNVVGGEKAILEINLEKKIAILRYDPNINDIVKRTVERHARSICKQGFLLENGERIGTGYTLEEYRE